MATLGSSNMPSLAWGAEMSQISLVFPSWYLSWSLEAFSSGCYTPQGQGRWRRTTTEHFYETPRGNLNSFSNFNVSAKHGELAEWRLWYRRLGWGLEMPTYWWGWGTWSNKKSTELSWEQQLRCIGAGAGFWRPWQRRLAHESRLQESSHSH